MSRTRATFSLRQAYNVSLYLNKTSLTNGGPVAGETRERERSFGPRDPTQVAEHANVSRPPFQLVLIYSILNSAGSLHSCCWLTSSTNWILISGSVNEPFQPADPTTCDTWALGAKEKKRKINLWRIPSHSIFYVFLFRDDVFFFLTWRKGEKKTY